VLEGSHILLLDIHPETVGVVGNKAQYFIREHSLPFTVSTTTDREEALQGANFIVNSIELMDHFELWEQDWRILNSLASVRPMARTADLEGCSIPGVFSHRSWRSARMHISSTTATR
jgi:alpha-galactosidase/6-phospho-beta-glucosidase family protein